MAAKQTLLIVGGNGFLGSAVARAAVARGWSVHSLSRSGTPPTMPDGTVPAFTSKVTYHSGSAFDRSSYAHLITDATAVVHSMGVLLEGGGYKQVLKGGKGVGGLLTGLGSNPLERRAGGGGAEGEVGSGTYEAVNRDSAVSVLSAVQSSFTGGGATEDPLPFVYVSAEDVFRPFIDGRYISTKREAEAAVLAAGQEEQNGALETLSVEERLVEAAAEQPLKRAIRPIVVRPGIMTSPTYRPLLSPFGPLLALSAALPPILPNVLRALSPRGADGKAGSFARMLETRTLDVDEVGEAICRAVESGVGGVIGVEGLRRLSKEGSVIRENRV